MHNVISNCLVPPSRKKKQTKCWNHRVHNVHNKYHKISDGQTGRNLVVNPNSNELIFNERENKKKIYNNNSLFDLLMFVCRRVWWSLPRYYKKKTTTKYNPLTILNNHFVCLFFFFVFLLSRDINHLNISRFLGAFNHVTLFTNAMGIDFVPWKPTTRDNRAYDRRSFIIRCEIISTSVFNWEKEKQKKKKRTS